MMVPRSSERTGDVALNALGFAGTTHIGISRPLLAPPNSKLLQLALPSHQRYTLSSRSIGPPSRFLLFPLSRLVPPPGFYSFLSVDD
eukprot:813037-Pyramimonas_sp.AAC.1